jgi:hypothetical protein
VSTSSTALMPSFEPRGVQRGPGEARAVRAIARGQEPEGVRALDLDDGVRRGIREWAVLQDLQAREAHGARVVVYEHRRRGGLGVASDHTHDRDGTARRDSVDLDRRHARPVATSKSEFVATIDTAFATENGG